jgi:hypothetical protein
MISKKELHRRATIKKAEIENEKKEKAEKREKEIRDLVEKYVDKCNKAMEKAADEGRFSVEVEILHSSSDLGKEVCARLHSRLSEFSPTVVGDGYTKEYINLSW